MVDSIGAKPSVAGDRSVARVAEIKKAIASGNFPILPATIADRLMALRLDWTSNDKA